MDEMEPSGDEMQLSVDEMEPSGDEMESSMDEIKPLGGLDVQQPGLDELQLIFG